MTLQKAIKLCRKQWVPFELLNALAGCVSWEEAENLLRAHQDWVAKIVIKVPKLRKKLLPLLNGTNQMAVADVLIAIPKARREILLLLDGSDQQAIAKVIVEVPELREQILPYFDGSDQHALQKILVHCPELRKRVLRFLRDQRVAAGVFVEAPELRSQMIHWFDGSDQEAIVSALWALPTIWRRLLSLLDPDDPLVLKYLAYWIPGLAPYVQELLKQKKSGRKWWQTWLKNLWAKMMVIIIKEGAK